ncbi:hypothetical protein [Halorarius halobius]|uniref:hypothetical protein n=1 Tax=Halorarius halobius TaxID=2962671 RepID=UPI0020CB7DA3|nr:hypothetical protein [Halorarius halobius]
MNVLSWNVQGAFPYHTPIERIENQLQYIDENAECPDIIALNEVNRFRRDLWEEDFLGKTGAGELPVLPSLEGVVEVFFQFSTSSG